MITILLCSITVAYAIHARAATASAQTHHSHRYDIAHRLATGLKGTPLERYAFLFESEGRRWNVNPFLVASIAGAESTFGENACGGNAWGIASCRVTYASFADGIQAATQLLRTGYLSRGLTTLDAVGGVYCQCGPSWAEHVSWFMRHLFGVATTPLTYP